MSHAPLQEESVELCRGPTLWGLVQSATSISDAEIGVDDQREVGVVAADAAKRVQGAWWLLSSARIWHD